MGMRKVKKGSLVKGMLIYGLVMLLLIGGALVVFWNFIAAFEASRPEGTISAYTDSVTVSDIMEGSEEFLRRIDTDIQGFDECARHIGAFVEQGITYAKKSSECTDDRMVYAIRGGNQTIGFVTMHAVRFDGFGFGYWEVTDARFDFDFLMGEKQRITVPSDYQVLANGVVLNGDYVVEDHIPYTSLEGFYGAYELPEMATYEADSVLGDLELTVLDTQGNPVAMEEDMDWNRFLDNCSQEEKSSLESFSEKFISSYVAFTGSNHTNYKRGYNKLLGYVAKDSDLYNRMLLALDGLQYAQSRGNTLVSVRVNRVVNIGDNRYLCDVTYEVDTRGWEGVVRTTNNARYVVVEENGTIKAESLIHY